MIPSKEEVPVDEVRGKVMTDVQDVGQRAVMPSDTKAMALTDHTIHEKRNFLTRPVVIGRNVWKSSDEPLPFLVKLDDYDTDKELAIARYSFPQALFENSPSIVENLKNYQYMKADLQIEVKINAQPFLMGALIMRYVPYNSQIGDFRRKGSKFMASVTSCPHAICTLEEANSMKITCPYANIYDMFDLANTDNQFGELEIFVFSPLVGTEADTSVNYTVFAQFVNPDFKLPTHVDVLPAIRDKHDMERLRLRGVRFAQSEVTPSSARDTGEVSATGPVSKISAGVAMVADVLSSVPVVGKVASTVAWVSRAIGNTAAVVGLSKPTTIVPQSKVVIKPGSTMVHTEGNDDSMTIALLQDNGIDGSTFIPEYKDEMHLDYILSRPNYFHARTVSAEIFSGNKLLTAWEVSPFSQYQYRESSDPLTLNLGSFAFASMQAKLWTGQINFNIKLVKTCYHEGRFVVVYLPETNLDQVPAVLGQLNTTNYNSVHDLKNVVDVNVAVPYMSNTPWRETYRSNGSAASPGPDATTLETKTGCMAIYALNDLVHPPTVAAQVTFYVSHSAGDGYQLGVPAMQLAPGFQSRYAQSEIGAVTITPDQRLLVRDSSPRDVTAQTTGEYFKSFRALIKRFNLVGFLEQSSSFVGFRTRHFDEDEFNGNRVIRNGNFRNPVLPTSFYMASFLYRFYNGSSMMKVFPATSSSNSVAFIRTDDENTDGVLESSTLAAIGAPLVQQLQTNSNVFEIRTPYYRAIRGDVVNSTQRPVLGDVRTYVRSQNTSGVGTTSVQSNYFEAAGDDFSFFFAIGPPVMCDIQNIRTVSTFPVGEDFTFAVPDGQLLQAVINEVGYNKQPAVKFQLTSDASGLITPAPPNALKRYYGISSASIQSVVLIYADGNVEVPITDCYVTDLSGVRPGLYVPRSETRTLDTAATAAALTAQGDFTFTSNLPIA